MVVGPDDAPPRHSRAGIQTGKNFMTNDTYERLTAVFHDVFGDDEIVLSPELTAKDVDGWDSLTHVRLMLTVERAFSIRLTASEIGRLATVGDLADLISRKTSPSLISDRFPPTSA